ncbi:ATP-dependent helicase [Acinetobacter baumannii]
MITVDLWQPADGLILEPNALRATKELERCLALTAGPGAGKTEMLAQKADFLLRTNSCAYPKRILAISFKVDASKNLKERVHRRCGTDLASRFDSYTFHAFAKRIIDRFRPVLTGEDTLEADYKISERRNGRSHNQISYEDLVPLAIQILKQSDIARNAIRQTYCYVFLDEFQDCTDKQYELVRLAFQGTHIRLTAVGDVKQKIMGWAGALDGIFKTFSMDFNAIPLTLYRNFRSKPLLLRMQNEIIRVLDPLSVMPDEQLAGNEGEAHEIRFRNSREEAEYLTDLITAWINNQQIPPSEIAILISKQPEHYGHHLIALLEEKNIPYRNEQQMQDITVEPAARLIVDYLSCLYSQCKPKAWIRLTNLLIPFAEEYIQLDIQRDINQLIKEHRKNIANQPIEAPYSNWWDCVSEFIKKIGKETLIALSPEYESIDHLKEIISSTKTRIEELLKVEPNLVKALARFSDDQAVRILTIHKSKGLEFDSVIILGVEHQTFWGKIDEERCSFFVGVSRAKHRLIMTSCIERERPPSYINRWETQRTPHIEFLSYLPKT